MIALKAKQIETRSWRTSYRGVLAIHASKKMTADMEKLCGVGPFAAALDTLFRAGDDLPLGAIVATCEIEACLKVRSTEPSIAPILFRDDEQRRVLLPPNEPERSFGDYTPGRYAWLLTNIRQLEFPILCRGAQGLWQVPPEIEKQIRT